MPRGPASNTPQFALTALTMPYPDFPELLEGNIAAQEIFATFIHSLAPQDANDPIMLDRVSRASLLQARADEMFTKAEATNFIVKDHKGNDRASPYLAIFTRLQSQSASLLRASGVLSVDRARTAAYRAVAAMGLRQGPGIEDAQVSDEHEPLFAEPVHTTFSKARNGQILTAPADTYESSYMEGRSPKQLS